MSYPDDAARFTALPDFAHRLVLVVGLGRSGTTALHQALGQHPALVDAPKEAPLERAIATCHGKLVMDSDEFFEYRERQTMVPWDYVEDTLRRLIFEAAFGMPAGKPFLDRTFDGDPNPQSIFGWVAKVGGLSPAAVLGFQALFEDFRPVYLHRNGIDTVASRAKFYGFSSKAFADNCRAWSQITKHLADIKKHADVVVVRHENLVSNPEQLYGEIVEFLGLDDDAGPATHSRASMTHPTQRPGTDSVGEHFAARAPAYEEWTTEQRQTFIDICGATMAEFGYDIPFA